jgi:Ethanolamine utilization protein EutJ (predicted chaperonin)
VVVQWQTGLSELAKQAASKNLVRRLRDELDRTMQIELREVDTFFPPGSADMQSPPGRLPRV